MSPQDVARATGVSTSTLRHYEQLGLLRTVHRTDAGHRRYPASIVDRVLLIQRALIIGFSLADVRRGPAIRDNGGAPCQSVRALVAARMTDANRQIVELRALRTELRKLLGEWDRRLAATPSGQPAHLLEGLADRSAIDRCRVGRLRHIPRGVLSPRCEPTK